MILKICRQKCKDNGKQGSTELITEIYSGERYIESEGHAEIGNSIGIPITDYEQLDSITNDLISYKILYAYLMNDNGKTIEKIV